MIEVAGALREYAWGRHDGLAEWTAVTDGPQAELWYGDHPSAPSPRPDGELPERTGELPLLVKLLAAARPLSIQVHPPDALAARWWAEREDGAPELADPHEKTELLLALDDFSTLVGFRPTAEVAELLEAVGLRAEAAIARRYGTGAAVAEVLRLGPAARDAALAAMPAAAATLLPAADASALTEVLADYPGDGGALVALCLRHHLLHPGDAVFVPAGTVHAYVRGLAVEVMTSSDNVLRLGLTPKHVDVDAALAAADVAIEARVLTSPGLPVAEYAPAGSPFAVARLHGLAGQEACLDAPAAPGRVVLAVHGTAEVDVAGGDGVPLDIAPGRALLLGPADPDVRVRTRGLAVVATSTP